LKIFIKEFQYKYPENDGVQQLCHAVLNGYLRAIKDKDDVMRINNLFEQFRSVYINWSLDYIGVLPQIDKEDSRALYKIIDYLLLIYKFDQEKAFDGWQFLMTPYLWEKLPFQFSGWMHLKQINKNLMNIIGYVKRNREKFTPKNKKQHFDNAAIEAAIRFDLSHRSDK